MKIEELQEACAAGVLLNSLADGIYVTDRDRKILFWNRAAERITGWRAEDIVGHTCYDDLLAHQDLSGNALCGDDLCPLHRAIVHGQSSTLPTIVFARTRDNRRVPVEVSVAPVFDGSGAIVGGIESFRDLSPLMQDMERAQLIQQHAMRVPLPPDQRLTVAIHNVPMEYVSGDFFRVEPLDADRYAVMVADVTGHGIAAALYAMQIRSLWEEARDLLCSPSAFTTHLNEKLFALTREDDCFASAVYGVLDMKAYQLDYVIAGHPAPFLVRGDTLDCLTGSGPALGLLPTARFQFQRQPLAPGDRLLFYTDGAIEVRDKDGNELEQEGLGRILLAQHGRVDGVALHGLEDALLAFGDRISFEDDLTLMGITLTA